MLLHKQGKFILTHTKNKKQINFQYITEIYKKFNRRSSFTKDQGASESSSMLFHPSLFLKFWASCRDTRKLNKIKVGNLKLLFLLCADAYLDLTIDFFHNFRNMQQICNPPAYLAIIFTYQLTIIYLKIQIILKMKINE